MSFVLRQPVARSKDHFRLRFIAASAAVVWLGASCAVPHTVALQPPEQADCRIGIAPGGEPSPVLIRWVSPESARDRALLNDWCGGVGPAIVAPEPAAQPQPVNPNELAVVSWNVHVGGGDVASLVERLRLGEFTGGRPVTHFVLLLQETHRQGARVPRAPSVRSAGAIQPQLAGRERSDIVATARRLGLSLYYVPSMRNGSPDRTDEDRGNAILSTLPLADLTAIELPFERQRRVAIEATIAGTRPDGNPWSLRLTNAHLDNRAPARRLWLFSIATRLRQARGLLQGMRHDRPAAILGGDLNTWYGFDDPAYRELAAKFPLEATSDRRPTFAGLLRLDHLLFRLPEPWTVQVSRLDRFGSDHHPLLGWIKF